MCVYIMLNCHPERYASLHALATKNVSESTSHVNSFLSFLHKKRLFTMNSLLPRTGVEPARRLTDEGF